MANRNITRAVRLALVTAGALGAGLYGVTSAAQEQLQEIVVTGSRIASANATSISPVVTIGGDDFAIRGVTRVEDMIGTLPQAFASQGSYMANGSFGTANVNLRNMGSVRTLVLVNGRRLPPGDPRQGGQGDLNTIPASLIERVEVLTGGASAVYGADAVAGVVNFIMNDKFEGIRLDAQYGFYDHKNDNASAEVVRNRGFPLPSSHVRDGYNKDFTLVMGANTQDGRGNATIFFNYTDIDPIVQANRDYSACTFNSGSAAGGPFTCGGSSTSATGRFWDTLSLTPEGDNGLTVADAAGNFRLFNAATDQFNYGPWNHFMRPKERYLGGAYLHYDLNDRVTAYAELQYMDDRDNSQIAPSGIFFDPVSKINNDNPLINDQFRSIFCVPYGILAGSTEDCEVYLGRRNVEGGPRNEDRNHQLTRAVAGLRGDINDNWTFDIYGMQGVTTYDSTYNNDLSKQRIARSLQVVIDPATGLPACKAFLDGSDLNCVPWNLFRLGGVTPEQTNYLGVPGLEKGRTQTRVVSGSVTGDLGDYGWKLPAATDAVGVAMGAEYREELLKYQPDLAYLTDELTGQGGASPPVNGRFDVQELFFEARIPLVQGKSGAENLSAELGYRWSDYSTGTSTNTYKVGLDWAPIDSLRFRASYQRAVRAPNIQELFQPQVVALDGSTDPCAGTTPTASAADCVFAGVPLAAYGTIRENPAQQYNGLQGGNPDLDPEEADTYSFGFVWNPDFVPGLMISLDYFDIEVKDAIGIVGADIILNKCVTTHEAQWCDAIVRDAPGTIWISKQGYVEDLNVNTGGARTAGIDVDVRYAFDIGAAGRLGLNFAGAYYDYQEFQAITGDSFYDCLGYFGNICGAPAADWRHRFTTSWNTPVEGLDVNLTWRYAEGTIAETRSSDPNLSGSTRATDMSLPSASYIDLAATYQFQDKYTFRLGINNLADKDPGLTGQRLCPTGQCNGNTWPMAYDIGRAVFMNVTADF